MLNASKSPEAAQGSIQGHNAQRPFFGKIRDTMGLGLRVGLVYKNCLGIHSI